MDPMKFEIISRLGSGAYATVFKERYAKKNLMIGDNASDALVYTLMTGDDSARFLARNITRSYEHRKVNRFPAEYVLFALHGHVVASSEENRFSRVKTLSSAVLHDEKKMFDVEEWLDACCLEIEKRVESTNEVNATATASSGSSRSQITTLLQQKNADEENAKLIAENARLKADLDAIKMKIASNPPTSPHSSRTHGSSNSSSPAAASGSPSALKAEEEAEVKKKAEEEKAAKKVEITASVNNVSKAQTFNPLVPLTFFVPPGASNHNHRNRIYSSNRQKLLSSQQGCRNGEKCQFSHQAKSG
jgi:hypothetical protein